MEVRTAYRQHWSRAQHHVTTSLMKLAVGERNVATNLGTISSCVIEYCFSDRIFSLGTSEVFSAISGREWSDLEIWFWGRSRSLKVARFDRPCMTFYWSSIITIALYCTVLFDIEWYGDLEIWLRDHSRSLKLVPFESLGAVSYSLSIVTMAVSVHSTLSPWRHSCTPLSRRASITVTLY